MWGVEGGPLLERKPKRELASSVEAMEPRAQKEKANREAA